MWYQFIQISVLIWIWSRHIAICNHSCEICFTEFIFEKYVITRVWNLPSFNMSLLSSKINKCKWIILGSITIKCWTLIFYFAKILRYLRRYVLYVANRWQWFSFHFYWLPEDVAILRLRISIFQMLFFKDLKYFDPGAIYRKHKSH
jgi:hypothetical protein